MAHRNHFDLLSSSQEPSQLIAQATNTAKNRKKKEKSKGKKAASVAEPVDSQPARDRNDKESQARTVQQIQAAPVHHSEDFEALQRRFTKDAQNSDCWSVWTEWLRRAKAESKDVKYKDGKGNAFTFQQALTASPALPRSVSKAVHRHMTPSDRDLLTSLLKVCLPAVQQSCKQLVGVVSDVSQQLDTASKTTKDAAAAALEGALKSFVRACEATADSGMPDLDSLDKEIATKQPLMQQAISQPDTVQTSTVDTAMQVVQLLHRKYEGEQCLSCGLAVATRDLLQAPSICAAAKADAEQLSSILTMHACSTSPNSAAAAAAAAAAQEPSGSPAVEAAIASLAQRVAALEAELASARAELRDAQASRSRNRKGEGAAPAPRGSQTDTVFAAKHAAQRLESIVMEVARVPSGETAKNGSHAPNSAVADSTLMQLLDISTHTAQMQDKLMDKLAGELEFAQARLVSASNMKSDAGIANARKLFSNVRAASSETHDSAARLEALVASLESAISSSPSFSTLRPMAMQVKQIAWQVYNSHNHLSANARPDAILEAARTTKGAAAHSITLNEILQMDVRGKGAAGAAARQQPPSTSSGLSAAAAADPNAAASRAATQGSSPAPSTGPAQPGHSVTATAPPAPAPVPVSMPPDNSVHVPLVYSAPMAKQQPAGIPAGFAAQPMHAMIARPGMVAAGAPGMPPQQAMLAQPAQATVPLQQFVPGQLFVQDGVPLTAMPPPGIAAAPVPEAAAAATRFDSQIAAAEAAAANLAKAMAAKPVAARGGRAGTGGRRGGAAVGRGRR